jgi:hypothetical protein
MIQGTPGTGKTSRVLKHLIDTARSDVFYAVPTKFLAKEKIGELMAASKKRLIHLEGRTDNSKSPGYCAEFAAFNEEPIETQTRFCQQYCPARTACSNRGYLHEMRLLQHHASPAVLFASTGFLVSHLHKLSDDTIIVLDESKSINDFLFEDKTITQSELEAAQEQLAFVADAPTRRTLSAIVQALVGAIGDTKSKLGNGRAELAIERFSARAQSSLAIDTAGPGVSSEAMLPITERMPNEARHSLLNAGITKNDFRRMLHLWEWAYAATCRGLAGIRVKSGIRVRVPRVAALDRIKRGKVIMLSVSDPLCPEVHDFLRIRRIHVPAKTPNVNIMHAAGIRTRNDDKGSASIGLDFVRRYLEKYPDAGAIVTKEASGTLTGYSSIAEAQHRIGYYGNDHNSTNKFDQLRRMAVMDLHWNNAELYLQAYALAVLLGKPRPAYGERRTAFHAFEGSEFGVYLPTNTDPILSYVFRESRRDLLGNAVGRLRSHSGDEPNAQFEIVIFSHEPVPDLTTTNVATMPEIASVCDIEVPNYPVFPDAELASSPMPTSHVFRCQYCLHSTAVPKDQFPAEFGDACSLFDASCVNHIYGTDPFPNTPACPWFGASITILDGLQESLGSARKLSKAIAKALAARVTAGTVNELLIAFRKGTWSRGRKGRATILSILSAAERLSRAEERSEA